MRVGPNEPFFDLEALIRKGRDRCPMTSDPPIHQRLWRHQLLKCHRTSYRLSVQDSWCLRVAHYRDISTVECCLLVCRGSCLLIMLLKCFFSFMVAFGGPDFGSWKATWSQSGTANAGEMRTTEWMLWRLSWSTNPGWVPYFPASSPVAPSLVTMALPVRANDSGLVPLPFLDFTFAFRLRPDIVVTYLD